MMLTPGGDETRKPAQCAGFGSGAQSAMEPATGNNSRELSLSFQIEKYSGIPFSNFSGLTFPSFHRVMGDRYTDPQPMRPFVQALPCAVLPGEPEEAVASVEEADLACVVDGGRISQVGCGGAGLGGFQGFDGT